jgi:rhodanese-related sulfurtransferase
MRRFLLTVLVLLVTLGFTSALWAEEAIWIDVRTAGEYSQGHVS